MPLITRRSSTRALPRVSVGRCGLIFENCAFVSQNWSRLIYASFPEAVNHATTFVPTLLWVRTLVNTFSPRDDRLALLRYAEEKLGISRSRRATAAPVAKASPLKPDQETPTIDPVALWNACHDPTGSPVEKYLERRGILEARRAVFGHALRYHPAFPFSDRHVACMVALVTDVQTAKPQAIHRTSLDADGNKITVDGKSRMALGPIANGCVRLTPDENVETCLGIAEGIETALSLQSLLEFGTSPIWACLNANGVENFPFSPESNVFGLPSITMPRA